MRELPARRIPETYADIKKLLYEQVPLLIEKLGWCEPKDVLTVVQAIKDIANLPTY